MNIAALLDQAGAHFQAGRMAEAERLFAAVLEADPDHAGANRMMGFLLFQQGRKAEALPLMARALERHADPATLVNYGLALAAMDRDTQALAAFEHAARLAPDSFITHYNRGSALRRLGRTEDALEAHTRAAALNPQLAEIHAARAEVLNALGRPQEALEACATALECNPADLHALFNRGVALKQTGRPAEALAAFDLIIAAKPDAVEALYNRACIHRELRQHRQAADDFQRVIALQPGYAEAHAHLGLLQQEAGHPEEALATFKALEAFAPGNPHAFGGLVASAAMLCDWPLLAALESRIDDHVGTGQPGLPVFSLMGIRDDPALFLQAARNIVAQRMPVLPPGALWQGAPYRHKRIKIAYLSADFRNHATAVLITELIEKHDRSRFEVVGISMAADDGSALGARVAAAFDQFHAMAGQDYLEVAATLRRLEIDIAIDLNVHTRDCFVDVFAHRPAPVQVNFLGFPGTVGAAFMDYILADAIVLPMNEQAVISERIVHLPDCYQPNDSKRAIADTTPSRAEAGLPEKSFVFACFNHGWKITAPVFDIWMRLLQAVPGSVLWLLETHRDAVANLRGEAARHGIDPQRLIFAPRLPLEQHLARHALADLFLDTMPYNAHTTGSDALWAGLPLLTCIGKSFPARVAASLLNAVGLRELITQTPAEYEALALALAREPARLHAMRARLMANRGTCALFDIERTRRGIEAALVRMWEAAEGGERPASFAVRELPSWRE